MAKSLREFIDPETGKPMDREWLDYSIEVFIKSRPWMREGAARRSKSEREIFEEFAPAGGWKFSNTRPSWQGKPRKVKRQMVVASLRRLISIGKIRVCNIDYTNQRSMHGMVRRNKMSDMHLFGKDHDGLIRHYEAGSILDALVKALGDL